MTDMSTAPMTTDAEPTEELQERLYDNLTRNIRALIGQRRLRRADLYRALGMSRQTFSARLSSVSRLTAPELLIIAHLLGVPAERLAEDPDHLLRLGEPTGEPIAAHLDRIVGPAFKSRCSVPKRLIRRLPRGVRRTALRGGRATR
jgi:transcriptional regulator with XRE-family HTH domain